MRDDDANLPGMIGRHPAMRDVYRLVRRVAPTDLAVVVVGETGTGKELVARAIHGLSAYRDGPFIAVNCAAIPETLAESELFGAERGAYTGAVRPKPGLLDLAHGGTLFLDEASSLPRSIQAKLLRALEHQEFRRVGGRRARMAEFRLISALARPLEQLLADGAFRDDFAYRIAGFIVQLPPLRTRCSDVSLLAAHFLRATRVNGGATPRLDVPAQRLLARYEWPGNVRELRTLIERLAVVVEDGVIGPEDVLSQLPPRKERPPDRERLETALNACHWRVTEAAQALGLGRTKLYQLMKAYGLRRPSPIAR